MHPTMFFLSTLSALSLALGACASELEAAPVPEAHEEGRAPRLFLVAGPEEQTVRVEFRRGRDVPGPRLADVRLRAAGLRILDASPGSALTDAGKQLMVRRAPSGETRLVALSADSLATIPSGTLAVLRVEPHSPDASLVLAADGPVLAPAAAARGLALGASLSLPPSRP